jgi:UDP-2,3-diacylglucosamine hydrolase
VLGRLAKLSDSGVRIVLFTGNHDMWSREYLEEECGMEIYYRPEVMEIGGRNIHVAHGDNINIGNKPLLRAMNAMFRSGALRWMFSWLIHPDWALKFGAWWSGKSRKSHGSEPITVDMLGYLVDYACEHKAHNANVELYIFGHMHLAHRVAIEGAEVLFLGDWSGAKAVYGAMTDDGRVELRDFEIYETIY